MEIVRRPSPNFGSRKGGAGIQLIVLHYTAMESAEAALDRLCDPDAEVSAHYLIGQDGALYTLVPDDQRAWHAGTGTWAGRADVNSASIGIELDNSGTGPYAEPLMTTLEALLADLLERHALPAKAVIGHSDLAPSRKKDPGPYFDWARLARADLSIWPEPALGQGFVQDAETFGYASDEGEDCILAAFRQRFRPGATGPICAADVALMAGLARQFPGR
ncbi:MAG: N-acetylmuramoyl-L-alanine amidase [Pseudomonadota bacterium]